MTTLTDRPLAGRGALVTGAAAGIGAAVVGTLARAGAGVVVVDVDGVAIDRLVASLTADGLRVVGCPGDAADEQAIEEAAALARRDFGGLHVVHANAGIGATASAADLELEAWQRVLDVNLTGCFLAARAGLRAMRAAGGGGSIVLTSSPHGLATAPSCSPYAATKAGILGLTRALALDGAPHGVRVNAVVPGAIDTPMVREFAAAQPDPAAVLARFAAIHPLGRMGRPQDIADAVLFLVSDAASFVTGSALTVDGGLLATLAGGVEYE